MDYTTYDLQGNWELVLLLVSRMIEKPTVELRRSACTTGQSPVPLEDPPVQVRNVRLVLEGPLGLGHWKRCSVVSMGSLLGALYSCVRRLRLAASAACGFAASAARETRRLVVVGRSCSFGTRTERGVACGTVFSHGALQENKNER